MKKSNKRGFTIVELVIVIAVIAILAAVLIPTFSNVIKKAQTSADIQACRQMNEYLAVNEVLAGKTITDAIDALEEGGMSAKNYKPLTAGCFYFWDDAANRVVYTSYNSSTKEYDVIYPEGFVKEGQWFSLSATLAEVSYSDVLSVSEGTVTLNNPTAEQFASFANDLRDLAIVNNSGGLSGFSRESATGMASNDVYFVKGQDIVINLDSDLDLKGAVVNLYLCDCSFTLNGNGHTISGISDISGFAVTDANIDNTFRSYGAGIVGYACDCEIVFNNVTIKHSVFGKDDLSGGAVLVGFLKKASVAGHTHSTSLTVNNVHVDNCEVFGNKKVGIITGTIRNDASLNISGYNTVKNCTISAVGAEENQGAAVICGCVQKSTLSTNSVTYSTAIHDLETERKIIEIDESTVKINATNNYFETWYMLTEATLNTPE